MNFKNFVIILLIIVVVVGATGGDASAAAVGRAVGETVHYIRVAWDARVSST